MSLGSRLVLLIARTRITNANSLLGARADYKVTVKFRLQTGRVSPKTFFSNWGTKIFAHAVNTYYEYGGEYSRAWTHCRRNKSVTKRTNGRTNVSMGKNSGAGSGQRDRRAAPTVAASTGCNNFHEIKRGDLRRMPPDSDSDCDSAAKSIAHCIVFLSTVVASRNFSSPQPRIS